MDSLATPAAEPYLKFTPSSVNRYYFMLKIVEANPFHHVPRRKLGALNSQVKVCPPPRIIK